MYESLDVFPVWISTGENFDQSGPRSMLTDLRSQILAFWFSNVQYCGGPFRARSVGFSEIGLSAPKMGFHRGGFWKIDLGVLGHLEVLDNIGTTGSTPSSVSNNFGQKVQKVKKTLRGQDGARSNYCPNFPRFGQILLGLGYILPDQSLRLIPCTIINTNYNQRNSLND